MPVGITTNVNCGLGKSKSKGQLGNLAHNRREFDPYNTDPNLAVHNEMVVQIGDCGEFGNFMRDEYDNFIDKNGNKVKWDKSARNYYDIDGNVVSNSKTLIANPKAEKARDMLEIYYKGGRYNKVGNGINQRLERVDNSDIEADFELPSFEERNPNFAIVCSVMHNDEWHGTPHLHIDFVPIGEGYKKGSEKQLGFERALACMGFTDRITAFYEWRDKERQILKDICNCYGIETKTKAQEQADYRGETLPVDVYSNAMRDAKADVEVIKESAKIEAKHIRKEAGSECWAAEQLRQNQEQLIQQEAERITRETVCKSQRERREYEKKREECDKIKAECEKMKKNLGRIIKHRSIELLKMTFLEIEQEKFAAKIKKLDEIVCWDFIVNLSDEENNIDQWKWETLYILVKIFFSPCNNSKL